MGRKIFISYSHQDHVCAQGIARFLLRQNYDVWIDVERIVSGQKWAADINEALQTADTVLAVISKNSVRRIRTSIPIRKVPTAPSPETPMLKPITAARERAIKPSSGPTNQ